MWQKLTSDSKILDMVQHCHLEFTETPVQKCYIPSKKFSSNEAELVKLEIQSLLKKGVIEKATPCDTQFVSSIFLRKKKNGSYRMILNLKGLNEYIEYVHFKMESLTCAIELMRKNCYMASIDLTDAYYTVPVASEHRKFLRFIWGNTLYQYTCLPNGLASAPRYFTKLLKPVYATLRSQGYLNVGYIDDSYIQGSSVSECEQNVLATKSLLESLGFSLSYEKSVLQPCQRLVFLGFILDSSQMRVLLTPEKANKIILACQALLNRSSATIRVVSQVIGLLVAALPGVKYGPLFYRNMEIDKNRALKSNHGNFEATMTISLESQRDLYWWVENLPNAYKDITLSNPSVEITTDASKTGWGAVCKGQTAQGMWSVKESQRHINELEIQAVVFGIKSFLPLLKDKHVCVKSDNSTAVCYINAMGGTKSIECNTLAKTLWEFCMENEIWLTACHLPGSLNIEADKQSRVFNERTEWHLKPTIFDKITQKLGKPEIDLFASRLNCQLPLYVSWKPDPGAIHVDAFSMPWNNKYVYMFPPFCLISRSLQKLEKDKGNALMIAPIWPTQVWWPNLMRMLVATPLKLPCHKDLLTLPHSGAHHPLKNQLQMMACHLSGNTTNQEAYQSQLPLYSCNPGGEGPRSNTHAISTNGNYFVLKGKLIVFSHL